MKVCRKCGEEKALDAFYRHAQMRDGHENICAKCKSAHGARYRVANLARVQAYDRQRGLLAHRKEAVKQRAPRYAEKHATRVKAYRETHPEKYKARNLVNNSLRDGRLARQPCERCGVTHRTHAHHDDYSKPLEVRWLCPFHHGERHRELNEQLRHG